MPGAGARIASERITHENAAALRAGRAEVPEAITMRDKIGIGKHHANHEEIIAEAEALLAKYGSNGDAATMTLRNQ